MIKLIIVIKCLLSIKMKGKRNIIIMMKGIYWMKLIIIKTILTVNKLIKKQNKQSVKKLSQFTLSLIIQFSKSQKFMTLN